MDDERQLLVELHRGSRGFGFSIRGGREFNNMPLFVLKVAPGGAAALDQRMKASLKAFAFTCNIFIITISFFLCLCFLGWR